MTGGPEQNEQRVEGAKETYATLAQSLSKVKAKEVPDDFLKILEKTDEPDLRELYEEFLALAEATSTTSESHEVVIAIDGLITEFGGDKTPEQSESWTPAKLEKLNSEISTVIGENLSITMDEMDAFHESSIDNGETVLYEYISANLDSLSSTAIALPDSLAVPAKDILTNADLALDFARRIGVLRHTSTPPQSGTEGAPTAPEARAAEPSYQEKRSSFLSRKEGMITDRGEGQFTIQMENAADVLVSRIQDFNDQLLGEGGDPEAYFLSSGEKNFTWNGETWTDINAPGDRLKIYGKPLEVTVYKKGVKAEAAPAEGEKTTTAAPEEPPAEAEVTTGAPEETKNPLEGQDRPAIMKQFSVDLEAHETQVQELARLLKQVQRMDYNDKEDTQRFQKRMDEFNQVYEKTSLAHEELTTRMEHMIDLGILEYSSKDKMETRMREANKVVVDAMQYHTGQYRENLSAPDENKTTPLEDQQSPENRAEAKAEVRAEATREVLPESYEALMRDMVDHVRTGNELKTNELELKAQMGQENAEYRPLVRAYNKLWRQHDRLSQDQSKMTIRVESFKSKIEPNEYQRQLKHLELVQSRLNDANAQLQSSFTQLEGMKKPAETPDVQAKTEAAAPVEATSASPEKAETRDERLDRLWAEKMPKLTEVAHAVNPDIKLTVDSSGPKGNNKDITLSAPSAEGELVHKYKVKIRLLGVGPEDNYDGASDIGIKYKGDDYQSIEEAMDAAAREFQADRQEGKVKVEEVVETAAPATAESTAQVVRSEVVEAEPTNFDLTVTDEALALMKSADFGMTVVGDNLKLANEVTIDNTVYKAFRMVGMDSFSISTEGPNLVMTEKGTLDSVPFEKTYTGANAEELVRSILAVN